MTLSPRQRQCLEYAAQGKSAWATSKILDIAESTVNFHRNQAMARLGVGTVIQAVAIAGARGLIHIEAP